MTRVKNTILNHNDTIRASRVIVRIELTPDGKRRSEAVADHFGMTQIATVSRLVEWFANQPETVQRAIVDRHPGEINADVARLVLEQMSAPASISREPAMVR